jgi:hypothetical protein
MTEVKGSYFRITMITMKQVESISLGFKSKVKGEKDKDRLRNYSQNNM